MRCVYLLRPVFCWLLRKIGTFAFTESVSSSSRSSVVLFFTHLIALLALFHPLRVAVLPLRLMYVRLCVLGLTEWVVGLLLLYVMHVYIDGSYLSC